MFDKGNNVSYDSSTVRIAKGKATRFAPSESIQEAGNWNAGNQINDYQVYQKDMPPSFRYRESTITIRSHFPNA